MLFRRRTAEREPSLLVHRRSHLLDAGAFQNQGGLAQPIVPAMQIVFRDAAHFMAGKPLDHRIIDSRLQQPAQRRMTEVVIMQIVNAGPVADRIGKRKRIARIATTLAKDYERIFLDCPPVLNSLSVQVMRAGDFQQLMDEAAAAAPNAGTPAASTVKKEEMNEWLRYFGVEGNDGNDE